MPTTSLRRAVGPLALAATLAACDAASEPPALARAGDHRLTTDEAATLLAGATQVPNDVGVVETIAELWVDYVLLAEAVAEDSTLSQLDLSPLVRQQTEIEAILALRDSMVRPDTTLQEGELEELYGSEGPGVEARARHILLSFPQTAPTPEQIDSLRSMAEDLRRRIAGGESFEDLARRYSGDPGSAARGGDLGFFSRGQMVRSFDEAVFALEPGELSDVVRSPYGFHVIRLEEKRVPPLEDVRDQFRASVQGRRIAEAESVFVAGVMEGVEMEVADDGIELTRQIAREPRMRISGRAADRALANYAGGAITVAEMREFMLTRPVSFRNQVAAATDEIVREGILLDLVRRERLLARATTEGFQPGEAVADSLDDMARERFLEAATQLGLASIEPLPGESRSEAVERRVNTLLREMLLGERQVLPMGAIGYVLRREYPAEVFGDAMKQRVVDRVADARGSAGPGAPSPGGGPAPAQGVPGGSAPAPGGSGGQPPAAPQPSDTAGG